MPDLFSLKISHHVFLNNTISWSNKSAVLKGKLNPKLNPTYTNFMLKDFKTHYKVFSSTRLHKQNTSYRPVVLADSYFSLRLYKSFKSYLRFNASSPNQNFIPHDSFKSFYLGNRKGGLAVLNVTKYYTRWKDTYHLLFNLYYYEIEILTFGTSFFKHEILSLNWQAMSKHKYMWRYTKPFLAFKANKITTYGDYVFTRLNLLGLKISMIIDVLYHNKTIYYLHRSGFYTIGLVPVNYNISTVNFAIPSGPDSMLGQLFLLRFLTLIKQNTSVQKLTSVKNSWSLYV